MSDSIADYLSRQRAVAARVLAEERNALPETKVAVLAALLASVDACGLRESLSEGDRVIWQRWQALRRKHGIVA